MRESGFPAYTTSAGWLGCSDPKGAPFGARRGGGGFETHFKQKVGGNIRKMFVALGLLREEIRWERKLMIDADQGSRMSRSLHPEYPSPSRVPTLVGRRTEPARTTFWDTPLFENRSRQSAWQQASIVRTTLSLNSSCKQKLSTFARLTVPDWAA